MKLRLSAASALAGWNVRRGVAQVVDLLDSRETIQSRMPFVRDNAMRIFRLKNIHKAWGFPDDEESASWPADVTPPPDVAARLKPPPTVEEIREWWSENKRRFPEWKLGDPLPGDGEGDVVVAAPLPFAPHMRAARGVEPETRRGELRTLPMSTEYVGTYSRNDPPATVSWEGRVYDAADAIRVLMDIAGNMEASIWRRQRALDFLQVFEYRLRGRKCIDILLRLYSELPTDVEKAAVLLCLSASEDPRAIPMFHTVLAMEKDHVLRLFAASGLAKWNIRAGVEELIRLLECGRSLRGSRHNSVREGASSVLMDLNAPKAWGFPYTEVVESARRGTENRVQIRGMLIKQWEEWFHKNEHRFPEWKPGDALPPVEERRDSDVPDPSDE